MSEHMLAEIREELLAQRLRDVAAYALRKAAEIRDGEDDDPARALELIAESVGGYLGETIAPEVLDAD